MKELRTYVQNIIAKENRKQWWGNIKEILTNKHCLEHTSGVIYIRGCGHEGQGMDTSYILGR